MKLSSTPKPIRFSFELDGRTFRSLDAIKADFKPFALKGKIDDGSFLRWLEQQNETELCNTISNRDKMEVADVVEIVYGWSEKNIDSILKNTRNIDNIYNILSYGIERNIIKADTLEEYYLRLDPTNTIWNKCEDILQKSQNSEVILHLAEVFKRRGNYQDYEKLIKYAALTLKDSKAKGYWEEIVGMTMIDGFDVRKIRNKLELIKDIQIHSHLDPAETYKEERFKEMPNPLKIMPNPLNREEMILFELIKLFNNINKVIIEKKSHYFITDWQIYNAYKPVLDSYIRSRAKYKTLNSVVKTVDKIIQYALKPKQEERYLIEDIIHKKPWYRINFDSIKEKRLSQVLDEILVALLIQDLRNDYGLDEIARYGLEALYTADETIFNND